MSNRVFSDNEIEMNIQRFYTRCEFAKCAKEAIYKIRVEDQELRERYCAEHYLFELQRSHSPERMAEDTELLTQ